MSKYRMCTKKPLERTRNLVQTKNYAYHELWMDWENPIHNIEKQKKIEVKLPHMNKKPLARKRTFVQTLFSL